ncbi:hypothetical protein CspeluHIS016_0902000 [Cutaneotrichosporon spelunceum]|uniref:Ricin B lectin domain-containing protein n=1 Tax=Cutaneotrichosporon spelunceum TaxID=1672016 RepID=A0AAD3TZX5_9TREE|nr:hypothetical protein CspeluHIS016_0902000 [Cutaneotrichosporon spelunceum]
MILLLVVFYISLALAAPAPAPAPGGIFGPPMVPPYKNQPSPANTMQYRAIRLPLQASPDLCLGLASRYTWGETVTLLPCTSDATRLVQRADKLTGFGTLTDHPLCLDVTDGDTGRWAQGYFCWTGNPNQEFEWLDEWADFARLRWVGSNKCVQVPSPEVMSAGHAVGGAFEGAKLTFADCNDWDPYQRWGWIDARDD